MNIGMQDAFNLGWKLGMVVRGDLPEAVLDTYETERRPIGAQNIEDTERLYGAILQTKTLGDSALRWLVPHLLGAAPVARRVAERFAQMDFRYAPNALIAPDHGGSGAGAGERAPDAFVARVETGETLRLFDLYRAGRWLALGWVLHTEDAATVTQSLSSRKPGADAYLIDATREGLTGDADLSVLRDMTQRAANAFGVSRSGVHLIRPDGVIAYRGAASRSLLDAGIMTG